MLNGLYRIGIGVKSILVKKKKVNEDMDEEKSLEKYFGYIICPR
jgi:hypothetical protein